MTLALIPLADSERVALRRQGDDRPRPRLSLGDDRHPGDLVGPRAAEAVSLPGRPRTGRAVPAPTPPATCSAGSPRRALTPFPHLLGWLCLTVALGLAAGPLVDRRGVPARGHGPGVGATVDIVWELAEYLLQQSGQSGLRADLRKHGPGPVAVARRVADRRAAVGHDPVARGRARRAPCSAGPRARVDDGGHGCHGRDRARPAAARQRDGACLRGSKDRASLSDRPRPRRTVPRVAPVRDAGAALGRAPARGRLPPVPAADPVRRQHCTPIRDFKAKLRRSACSRSASSSSRRSSWASARADARLGWPRRSPSAPSSPRRTRSRRRRSSGAWCRAADRDASSRARAW